MTLSDTTRQQRLIAALAQYVEKSADISALVVVGSFADGTADAVSDLDLFFISAEGRFKSAWKRRHDLHVTGALVWWDESGDSAAPVAGHRWVTPDLVLVESVISEPAGGGRLAEPFTLIAGDRQLVENFPRRPPIDGAETIGNADHPVDIAYDAFKRTIRDTFRR